MNKNLRIQIIRKIFIIVFVWGIIFCIIKNYRNEYELYCYNIFCEIKNLEFEYAKFKGEDIVFYDKDFAELYRQRCKVYNSAFKILFIENKENTMSFWKSGFLDDGTGVLFIKDDEINDALSGIKKLKRSGGNSYWFTT